MNLNFAELQKRWQVRTVVGLTLESGRVVVDLVRREEGGSRVVKSFALPFGAESVVADPEKIGQQLAAQLAAEDVREKRCVVCIPAGWALTTATELPSVAAEDLRGYLELRAEREFPISVSDLRIAHCTYTLPGGKSHATIAAVPTKRIEAVERLLAAAGCRAVSISLGLDGCMPRGESRSGLHFLANGNHVDVVISAGGGIAALRSLPGPMGPDAAAFDAGDFSREVRITLGRLPEPLRAQIREAQFGGAANTAEALCGEIRQNLQRMGIESRLTRVPGDPTTEHVSGAIEAAAQHLRREPVTFEFLPPQVHRWQGVISRFDDRRRRWIAGAVAGAIVLPALIFLVRGRIEGSLESEWDGMRRNVGELESVQLKIRQFRPWFEPTPQNLQILEGLTESFPDEGTVWAKSIQIGEGFKVTCTGFAKSQGALHSLIDRVRARPDVSAVQVQQERGENPVQFSFTYKWEARDAK